MCACVGNPKMNPASGQLHNNVLSHTNRAECSVWAASTTIISSELHASRAEWRADREAQQWQQHVHHVFICIYRHTNTLYHAVIMQSGEQTHYCNWIFSVNDWTKAVHHFERLTPRWTATVAFKWNTDNNVHHLQSPRPFGGKVAY